MAQKTIQKVFQKTNPVCPSPFQSENTKPSKTSRFTWRCTSSHSINSTCPQNSIKISTDNNLVLLIGSGMYYHWYMSNLELRISDTSDCIGTTVNVALAFIQIQDSGWSPALKLVSTDDLLCQDTKLLTGRADSQEDLCKCSIQASIRTYASEMCAPVLPSSDILRLQAYFSSFT